MHPISVLHVYILQGNTVYLALITGRIPVMPPFTPSHIGGDAENIPFGEVFDVPRLRSLINSPVVEWHDLKARESDELEHLGCWSIWQSQQYYEYEPRMTWLPQELHLDIAYTKSPSWVKSVPGNEHDKSSYFFDLAKLAFPEARDEYLNSGLDIKRTPSPIHHMISDPDDHLLCMDYLYYVTANPVCSISLLFWMQADQGIRVAGLKQITLPHGDLLSPTCISHNA